MTDKPVRLTAEQMDRLIILAKRQVQLKQQKLAAAGLTPEQIAAADSPTKPLVDGGAIDIEGTPYRLAGHDAEGVTLRKV